MMTDHDSAILDLALKHGQYHPNAYRFTLDAVNHAVRCAREIRHVVRAKQECSTMRPGELVTLLVAERLRLQAIRNATMRRRTRRWAPGADRALMREQRFVWTAAVAEMLVDVDDRLG